MLSFTLLIKKAFIRLKCNFILNKKLRRRKANVLLWKFKKQEKAFIEEKVKKSRWGISYSVFDGEELLEASLKSVRNCANYINVVYQTKSWYGNDASQDIIPLLLRLKQQGLIDEIIYFMPDFTIGSTENELNKRNLGLKYAKKAKCDYFMVMDVDEFFFENELNHVKKEIIKRNVSRAFCHQIFYLDSPTKRVVLGGRKLINGKECGYTYAVPVFSKINKISKLSRNNKHVIAIADQTKILCHTPFAKYFIFGNIFLHHMSILRKDIGKKVNNSSSFKAKAKEVKNFANKAYVEVDNYWDIKI